MKETMMKRISLAVAAFVLAVLSALGERLNSALFGYMANRGMVLPLGPGLGAPARVVGQNNYAQKFAGNVVIDPAQSEVVRWRLYDSELYLAAGQPVLNFFQQNIGQGVTTAPGAAVGGKKTIFDTNMQQSGSIPNGMAFLLQSIEVLYWPGGSSAANTFTVAAMASFATAAVVGQVAYVNDVNTFYSGGALQFNVLNKNYLYDLTSAFPPKTGFDVSAAAATNSATVGGMAVVSAARNGRPFWIDPEITLQPMVNFNLSLNWAGLVTMPSTFNGRVQVILDGLLMRASQ